MGPRPTESLAPYVASLTAYDVDLGAPGIHRGLPSTTVTLVLPAGEPLDVSWAGDPASRRRGWSSLSGLHPHPAEIHHQGRQSGVQVALTVAGARALLGVPAADLAGGLLDLDDLGEVAPRLRHLPERLAATSPGERSAVVATALLAELARRRPAPARREVEHALGLLSGGAPVQRVADEVGYSRRHLGSLVRAETGLAPKQVQRLGRFEASRARVGRAPLAEVAHACGYADQAHLTREWVALAGCPPSTWLREEFPFLQDLAEDRPAG
ncbi:MAG TPA: helix-turn-helix domain-containing protein [Nocardioides sp.]|nr:helix-turn-helix domain-containing protein [Nocardioides sp.]